MAELVRTSRGDPPVEEPTPPPTTPTTRAPPTTPPPPAAAAPGGEMGQWIEEMIRQGIITRATPEQEAMVRAPVDGVSGAATAPGGGTDYLGLEANDPNNMTRGDPPGTTPAAGDLPYPGAPAWINSPMITPEERAWFIEHKYVPPPWAGDPTVAAPLSGWNRSFNSGFNALTDEYYNHYGGDQILEAIRKYDPNAHYEDSYMGGGEGDTGTAGTGRRLVYDERLMPMSAGPLGWMRPTSILDDKLHSAGMKYYDPLYGWVTDPRNTAHPQDAVDKWMPAAAAAFISLVAPYAAPALFGAMGVPAAAAGFTSAVTGGIAGLGAGSIPGSFAAAGGPLASTQLTPSAGRQVASGLRTGGQLGSQFVTPHSPAVPTRPPAPVTPAGAAPYNPAAYGAPTAPPAPGTNMTRLPRNQVLPDPYGAPPPKQQGVTTPKRTVDPYGFDPTLFNSGGSTPSVRNNDSKLVATNFADDPYRFS